MVLHFIFYVYERKKPLNFLTLNHYLLVMTKNRGAAEKHKCVQNKKNIALMITTGLPFSKDQTRRLSLCQEFTEVIPLSKVKSITISGHGVEKNPFLGAGFSFWRFHFKTLHMHINDFVVLLFNNTFTSSQMKQGSS